MASLRPSAASYMSSARLAIAMFLTCSPVLALSPHKAVTQYSHTAWSEREGLPTNGVRTLLQSRKGFIWIGTSTGLARFDGVNFVAYDESNVPLMHDEDIRALEEGPDGSLWIGTFSGGLLRMHDGRFTHYGKSDGLASEMIRDLDFDRAGNLWIATYGGGLARFRDGRFTTITKKDGLADDHIKAVLDDRQGNVWAGSFTGGVSRIDPAGKITNFAKQDGLSANFILDIEEARDGVLWFATYGGGLARLENGKFTAIQKRDGLADDRLTSVHEDRHGNVWIGTYAAGLQRLTAGRITTLTADEGLSGDLIFDLMEDREGNLWIATYNGGIDQLRDGIFTSFTEAEGLSGVLAWSITEDASRAIWVGVEGGGVTRLGSEGNATVYRAADGLASDNVVAVLADSRGNVWMGTFEAGLTRFRDGQFNTLTKEDGLSSDFIYSLYEDRQRRLWIGTRGGGVMRYDGSRFETWTKANGLVDDRVRAIHQSRSGAMWFATDGGISVLENGRFTNYAGADELSTDAILSFHEDVDGVIWIATRGGGVMRWENGRFFTFRRAHGLPDETFFRILEDERGNLWMSSLRGVVEVRRSEMNDVAAGRIRSIQPVLYGTEAGMKNSQCLGGSQPAGWRARDGKLWFPTANGVVSIDPRARPFSTLRPNVYVEALHADQTAFPLQNAVFPAGTRNVEIRYTSPTFTAPDNVRFLYRLENFDEGWIDAGTRRIAYYTNIPPGKYRFLVRAVNNDGVYGLETAAATFSLRAHFYRTPLFYFLLLTLLTLLLMAIIRFRVKLVRTAEQARTAELELSLLQAQKMEALGRMASGIAHDFNNTLMTALPWAEILGRKYPSDPFIQKVSDQIKQATQRASSVTRQLLDFAQPKRPERQTVELAQLVREQVEFIRPSIPPEIEIEVSTPAERLFVNADSSQLQQILLNLALNAKDAMRNGGTLTFEVRRPTAEEVAAVGGDVGDPVLLMVCDTGGGIDDATRSRIFDPFFTTKGVGKGTGLGLAVVHRLVEEHGGRIVAKSHDSRGTAFSILLPGVSAPLKETSAPGESEESVSRRLDALKVMVVDDEENVSEGIRLFLESVGADVEVYDRGAAALAAIDGGSRPDVVVLDLGMPEMTGDQVHRELRRRQPTLPIVISSGYGDRERIDPLLTDGYTRFKQKPYPIEDLVAEIEKATGATLLA